VRCDPTLRDHAPDGPAWLHEIKIDGCRAQVHIHHGPISVYSGSGYNRPTTAARSCRSWRRNGCFDDRFGMALFPFRSGGILGHGSTVCSCFARYLDFAWRAFAAHSLDAQAKLFSLAVVGGLACELLHHSATLEPAARRAPQGCFKKDGVAFSPRREMDARGRPTHELHIRVRTRRSE
jgi:hypothetical protein